MNWWAEKWLSLADKKEFQRAYNFGRNYYKTNKLGLKRAMQDNNLQCTMYDMGISEKINPKITFKKFTSKEKKNIENLIESSPLYLIDLLQNKISKEFCKDLLDNNIQLIPDSFDQLNTSCYCKGKPCEHVMILFYMFGVEIDKNPKLLFTVHGLDLEEILKPYAEINLYEIRKYNDLLKEDLLKENLLKDRNIENNIGLVSVNNFSKSNDNESKNEFNREDYNDNIDLESNDNNGDKDYPEDNNDIDEYKQVNIDLLNYHLHKLPNMRETIEKFLSRNPKFFSMDFRKIVFTNMNHWFKNRNRFVMGELLTLNFEPFMLKNNDEAEAEFRKRLFKMKWEKPWNMDDLQIKLNKNYELEYVSNFSNYEIIGDFSKYKISKINYSAFLFYEFLFEMPKSLINQYNYTIQFSYMVFEFVYKLIEKNAIIPELLETVDGFYFLRWIPTLFNENIENVFNEIAINCPDDLILIDNKEISKCEQTKILFGIFISLFIHENSAKSFNNLKNEDVFKLFFNNKIIKHDFYVDSDRLIRVNKWLSKLLSFENEREVYLTLIEKNDLFHLDLKLKNNKTIKQGLKKYNCHNKVKLLSDLYLLNQYFPQVSELINKGKKLSFSLGFFDEFYFEILPNLKILNFKVQLPKSLEEVTVPKISMDLKPSKKLDKKSDLKKGILNLENLVDFDWKIAMGDRKVSFKEFKKLVKDSPSFIKLDNKLYRINERETDIVSKKIKKIPKKLKSNEILQTILSSTYEDMNVNIDTYFSKVQEEIANYEDVDLPKNINGTLRPYQKRGFSWLVQNMFMHFGSILADDMGLGKTVQVLTTVLHFKNNNYLNEQKVLVIAPTAVLLNWENEIKKFTPDLKSMIYHGDNREIDSDRDLIITSYGMIRSDFKVFNDNHWFLIVVDEAQNIKNPSTKQSQLIKKLNCEHRMALTGTPVENRLTDYWSIFDFTNKSYLEGHKKFRTDFVSPIEKDRDLDVLEKFKKITSPFILRRLKTDKTIINDLPDKIENEMYCYLTKDQATLYQKTIDTVLNEIENSEGIERKGLVLKLIMSLKQICNHPAQYTKSNKFSVEQSGKMEMLIDILENIEYNKEKVVIFTQFVQMGKIIQELLEKTFDMKVLFYHGSLRRKIRDKMIDDFQNNPKLRIMIVSLKAGGTGLNLTAATNVIHYDLWWNPAVENQATDRVYRIGQKKNVMVYRFISSGTFEEEINTVSMKKKELAEITVGTGENFVTEMNDKELKNLFTLRRSDI
ncbi:MAG: DEAD/DEAH box helicase [Methanobrevibacter sp.]|jgi:superfamily II DNA or RNA helicase/uncharacterized Zn finger protein|nr:DEAD/DEAH box helicase [Methanobrevibacter sp.]